MRKNTLLLLLFLLVGCSNRPTGEGCPPSWLEKIPQAQDAIYGIGESSVGGKEYRGNTRDDAATLARNSLATQTEIKVNVLLKNHFQKSGPRVNSFVEQVSKQVASQTLSFAIDKEAKYCGETVYMLTQLSLVKVRQAILDNMKEKEAQYNEFRAQKGFDELDKAVQELK